MTDGYTKLKKVITTVNITSTQVASIFFDEWISPYGIASTVISENGQQSVSKCSTSLCFNLVITKPEITAFHAQTNGRMEWYHKTLVSRLRSRIADNQKNWNILVKTLTCAHNGQVHCSATETFFSLLLLRHSPGPISIDSSTVLPADADNGTDPVIQRRCIMVQLPTMQMNVSETSAQQQARYERCFSK